VGPATMSFRGDIEVQDVDPQAMSLRLIGKGTDTTGTSGAKMNLLARIAAVDGGTSELIGSSEVTMSGKAASFGGRMMNSVADRILQQFADNVAAEVAALQAGESGAEAAKLAPASRELNAFALVWAIFRDWLRGLFRRKKA